MRGERFAQEGLDSMWEVAPGRGRKPSYGQRKIAAIVSATLTTKLRRSRRWCYAWMRRLRFRRSIGRNRGCR